VSFAFPHTSSAQTITPLTNQIYDGFDTAYLMTDGTVIAQDSFYPGYFWKLTPDINGSYVNGTWSLLPELGYAPYAFSGAVLADGRLLVVGGEYSGPSEAFTLTAQSAIYNSLTNTWSNVTPPQGWINIGDSPNTVLPNGNFLVGQKLTEQFAELNPSTMKWTILGSRGKSDFNSEEGWTLLPNGNVLTADVHNAPNSEIFWPKRNQWVSAGTTIVDLHSPTDVVGCIPFPPGTGCYYPPGEIGPAILRPDGTVFFTGSYSNNDNNDPGHTAVFNSKTGVWSVGPDFPLLFGQYGDNAGDNWAVLLPNGNVFVEGQYGFGYEFDGTNMTLTSGTNTYLGAMIVLPTGEVLFGGAPYNGFPVSVYASTGTYQSSWTPVIGGISSSTLIKGDTYRIFGQQFNGLSQACAFGDEDQCATNYPLVRITNTSTGHVFYARTHNHSSMGVATGTTPIQTWFDVSFATETGPSTLVVVANGIPSQPINITITGCGGPTVQCVD
jgi:hypothetical protein